MPTINVKMPAELGTQYVGFWTGVRGWNTDNLWQAGVVAKMLLQREIENRRRTLITTRREDA